MHYFLCFHVSWGTFRLLGDLKETNFVQKVPLGDQVLNPAAESHLFQKKVVFHQVK